MANFNSPLNLNDDERNQMLSMDELFNRTSLRQRALRRLRMFVPEVEEVFSESSSFYDSEMDFGERVPRPQLQRQNAMPLNVEDIPLPTGPAPLSATLPIVLFIDLTDLDEMVEGKLACGSQTLRTTMRYRLKNLPSCISMFLRLLQSTFSALFVVEWRERM